MADNSFTEVMHPRDPVYLIRRQEQINRLLQLSVPQLKRQLQYMTDQAPPRADGSINNTVVSEMYNAPFVPDTVKNILGTTSGSGLTDGSALIRQDLEPVWA